MKQKTYSKLGLVFLGSALIASAAPIPFVTDDTKTVKLNQVEVDLGTSHTQTSNGWAGTAPSLEVKYGLLPNIEVGVRGVFNYIDPSQSPSTTGYGDTTFDLKYNFIREEGNIPSLAFAPSYSIPTGNDKNGLGSGHNDVYLPLLIEKTFGTYTVDLNGGYGLDQGDSAKNWQYVGVAASHKLTDSILVGAEVYNRSATSTTAGSDFAFNLGAGIKVTDNQSLYITAGRSFVGPTDLQASLTYKITFGGENVVASSK